jgi:hypothetical protein
VPQLEIFLQRGHDAAQKLSRAKTDGIFIDIGYKNKKLQNALLQRFKPRILITTD